jgi:hypothetical protein
MSEEKSQLKHLIQEVIDSIDTSSDFKIVLLNNKGEEIYKKPTMEELKNN